MRSARQRRRADRHDVCDGIALFMADSTNAQLALAPFVTPETFLAHHGDGSFPGGDATAIASLLRAITACPGVSHIRFELQAWEDIEDAPYAESIWVLGTTKKAIAAALKGHFAAPDAIEAVASNDRPPELWPGRWLRLWWD